MPENADDRFLAAYHWVERVVSAVILMGMVAVVILATWSFLVSIWSIVAAEGAELDYAQFQQLFDRVLAAVIAVELAHSIRQMVAGEHGFGQLRTVITIGMLAVVRKLIVLEANDVSGLYLAGLAAAIAALAVALMALRWVEDRRQG